MRFRIAAVLPLVIVVSLPAAWGLQQAAGNASAQQHLTELKQAMAANRGKLMKYQWVQSTEVSVKGKVRKDQQMECRYGADGKVVKTPIGVDASGQMQEAPRGIRGRIVAKKKEEMQDESEQLKALISNYAPPDPEMIKMTKQAGNASLNAAGGIVTLSFANYYKPGDKISFGFDRAAKKLVSYDVNTYLDDPKNDIVTMTNRFASLPDGTNYLRQTVLNAKSKQIQITTTNSNYAPLSQ
jgi:hypothetical protein